MPEATTAMISCKECATPNSLDSAFCKKCGKPLAQEESIDARETIEKQLDHGFELFHHGRTDEAWLNVESCLLADPENLRALSLKGMILERRGLIHEALDCFEKIVAKDPNAALERMKLQTLRGMLDLRKNEGPAQRQRFALAIAVCATLLVISVAGAFAFSRRSQPDTQTVASKEGERPYIVDNFSQTDRAQALKQASQTEGNTDQKSDGAQQNATKSDENQTPPQYTQRPAQSPLNGALPNPAETDSTSKPVNPLDHAQITPVQANAAEQSVPTPTNNANVGAPVDNSHSSDPDPSAVAATTTQKPTRPAVVDIKLSEDQPKESDLAIDANGIEAMLRAARSQFQIGSYQAAASTYEKALSAGADPAMTNQRLAQCYERLGRTSEAKAAYGRAISAIQSQIDGGKGNKDRLLAALNSSQQALRNLQGG